MECKAKLGGAGLNDNSSAQMGTPLNKPAVGYVNGTSPKLPGKENSETVLGASPVKVKGKGQ